jgi:hypothetical protein
MPSPLGKNYRFADSFDQADVHELSDGRGCVGARGRPDAAAHSAPQRAMMSPSTMRTAAPTPSVGW